MIELTPNYYKKFRCIADRCRHSCCIGWEIDIDEDTMSYYLGLKSEIGEKIRRSIEGNPPHFVMSDDERCPFLNKNGLCEIITLCGEEALCDICRLHPRFSNFYDSFTETGLGLCCEEAVRIVLSECEKFRIVLPKGLTVTREEREFLKERDKIFNILQNREISILERFSSLAKVYGFEFCYSLPELCDVFLSLERLDERWTYLVEALRQHDFDCSIFEDSRFDLMFENLACYFIFRHLSDAAWLGDYAQRVAFCLVSCYFTGALISNVIKEKSVNIIEVSEEIIRMYSSEIEYSEENLDKLLTLHGGVCYEN